MEFSVKNKSVIRSFTVVTAIFIALSNIAGTNAVKCDKIVEIESQGLLDYLGNVTFSAPGDFSSQWNLTLKTTIEFDFIGGSHVWVKANGFEKVAYFQSRESVNIKRGEKVSFRYRIRYEQTKHIPYANNIKWEKWTICDGEKTLSSKWNRQTNSESELSSLDLEGSSSENKVRGEEGSGRGYLGSSSENAFRRRRRQ